MQDTEKTIVVFRVWNAEPKTVIALFPLLPGDYTGRHCVGYEHVGQHGSSDYHGVIAATRPASTNEYAPLAAELRGLGYNLAIRRRAPSDHCAQRRAATADT